MPTLYMIATPIGNLKDITLRALDVLREVDLIVCEDTRHSRKLLSAYDIHKPLRSAHSYNEAATATQVVAELSAGKSVAYVTDAGTPGISDPGAVLSRVVRAAGHAVVPIPGASAFGALVSISGFGGKTIAFEGFLSPKSSRRRNRLRELLAAGYAFVLYESPYRVLKLLDDVRTLAPARRMLLGREMTKLHEEYLEGSAEELLSVLSPRGIPKGEFVLLMEAGIRGDISDDDPGDGDMLPNGDDANG